MTKSSSLDALWWLWLPVLAMGIQIILELSVPRESLGILHSEWGPHESLQFVVIGIAFLVALHALIEADWKTQAPLGGWFALAGLCCLYVAGEEISWGQHVFLWETSEYWQGLNDQGETNLHNTSSWLDQKPRLLLFIGIVIGGLVIPFFQRVRPALVPQRFAALYPDPRLWVTAALVALPYLIQKIASAAGLETFARVSEVQELYMYYFVLLYLWSLRSRALANR